MSDPPRVEGPRHGPPDPASKLQLLVARISRNWSTIFPTLWGPVLGLMGLALGTRLVTEVVSTETFGSVKLAQGAMGLGVAILARPFAQFSMRAFHDAVASGREAEFVGFVGWAGARVGAVIASLVGVVLAGASAFGFPVSLAVAALTVPLTFVEIALTLELSLAQTRNEQRLVSVLEVTRQWFLPVVTVALVWALSDSPSVFVLAQLVFTAAAYLLVVRATRHHPSRPADAAQRHDWAAQARAYGGPIVVSGAFSWMLSLGDRFLLAHYAPAEEVGRYAAVYGLLSTPIVAVGGTLARIFYPFVFRSAARGHAQEARSLLIGMAAVSGGVGVLAVIATAVVGEPILSLALAAKFVEGADRWMVWIAAGNACLAVSYSLDLKMYAEKSTSTIMVAAGAGALVNVGINLALIPTRGAEGAAIATFFGYASYLVVIVWVLWRRSGSE